MPGFGRQAINRTTACSGHGQVARTIMEYGVGGLGAVASAAPRPCSEYKNHQIPFPLPRNVMSHPASASHHAGLARRRREASTRRDERRLRRERRGRREWRRACLRVCCVCCVCLCLGRHAGRPCTCAACAASCACACPCTCCVRVCVDTCCVLGSPQLLATPGHHQCVYL